MVQFHKERTVGGLLCPDASFEWNASSNLAPILFQSTRTNDAEPIYWTRVNSHPHAAKDLERVTYLQQDKNPSHEPSNSLCAFLHEYARAYASNSAKTQLVHRNRGLGQWWFFFLYTRRDGHRMGRYMDESLEHLRRKYDSDWDSRGGDETSQYTGRWRPVSPRPTPAMDAPVTR